MVIIISCELYVNREGSRDVSDGSMLLKTNLTLLEDTLRESVWNESCIADPLRVQFRF